MNTDRFDISSVASLQQATAEPERNRLVFSFWLAVAATLVLYVIPYGEYLLYPFALLSTWAHEMGHGITALLVGGSFQRLELYADLGGVAVHGRPDTRLAPAIVSAGGLLGPAIVGGLTVFFGSRPRLARFVLDIFAALLLISLLLWVRNLFGIVAVLLLAAGFGMLAELGSETLKLIVAQFTGIQLCLGSLSDFDYMFTRDFVRDGQVQISDSQAIAEQLWLPYWFWGGLIAILSLLILFSAFWLAWVRPARRSELP